MWAGVKSNFPLVAVLAPKVSHYHAALGRACVHDLTVADINAGMVYLIPAPTETGFAPENQVPRLKLYAGDGIAVIVAVFRLRYGSAG